MSKIGQLLHTLDISCVRQMHTYDELEQMCEISLHHQLAAVFVMPSFLPFVAERLKGQECVKPASVISFPNGADTTAGKVRQAEELYQMGCREFDMVMNLTWLKNGEQAKIIEEIKAIKSVVAPYELKVIIEIPLLNDVEIQYACDAIILGAADYVKTGTGWGLPTTYEMIRKIKSNIGESLHLKAAGGIDSAEKIEQMYQMGCDRFGIGLGTWRKLQKDI